VKSTTLLVPLPSHGYDPTEAAIPWQLLSGKHIQVTFATPDGRQASADNIMLTGKGLGIWKPVLRTRRDAIAAHRHMLNSNAFKNPRSYEQVQEQEFDALLLPGGHDKGVKEYLESTVLQQLVVDFFRADKPVAAICHGVVLAARSIDAATGKSVLYDYQTTALLKSQEMLAYKLTRLWLKDYYLTYPEITVEDEVTQALSNSNNFQLGPRPVLRDSPEQLQHGFALRDRNYLSARWPGDAYTFSGQFAAMLENNADG